MSLNSKKNLISRLRRGKQSRQQFVESHLSKALTSQIKATRDKLGWSQERLAEESGMNQNAISRLESLDYGKPTLTTLKRLAAAMDVGLTVRLVPFSEMIDWVSGTPRTIEGLTTGALAISCFDREEREGAFAESTHVGQIGSGAADSFVKPPQNQGAGSLGSFLSNTAQNSALRAYSSKGIANEARRPMWNRSTRDWRNLYGFLTYAI